MLIGFFYRLNVKDNRRAFYSASLLIAMLGNYLPIPGGNLSNFGTPSGKTAHLGAEVV